MEATTTTEAAQDIHDPFYQSLFSGVKMIYFFYPYANELGGNLELSSFEAWFFNNGPRAWILQTYLELRKEQICVDIGNHPPTTGIVVCHKTNYASLLQHISLRHRFFLVCVRADKTPSRAAHVEIVQNKTSVTSRKQVFIPHWPQPGLLSRKESRGTTIQNAAFKGSAFEIHPQLLSDEWKSELAKQGVSWHCSPLPPKKIRAEAEPNDWHDFETVDVFIAIRKKIKGATKPASKLVNCWIAGTPAILGSEVAYQELRNTSLDYLEAEDPNAALRHLDSLISNPALYQSMRLNGIFRSKKFDRSSVKRAWLSVLEQFSHQPNPKIPFLLRAKVM